MTRTTLPTAAAALTATAALLLTLTACGSDGPKTSTSDKIAGADSTSMPTASPSASASTSGVKRPTLTFPPDVKYVFEDQKTGNTVKDAVLADNEQAIKAVDAAITAGDANYPAIGFYYEGEAAASSSQWVKSFLDDDITITGTVRYYHRQVTLRKDGSAELLYCGDESKGYNKDRKTGKVDKTPATADSYVVYNTLLTKNKQGVWQTTKIVSQRGAKVCQP